MWFYQFVKIDIFFYVFCFKYDEGLLVVEFQYWFYCRSEIFVVGVFDLDDFLVVEQGYGQDFVDQVVWVGVEFYCVQFDEVEWVVVVF